MTLLGKDSTKDLLEKAADQGIDVLVVFEVEVTENVKTNLVTTRRGSWSTTWPVVSRSRRSKPLNNFRSSEISGPRKRRDEEDPVTVAFDEAVHGARQRSRAAG